MSDVTGLRLDPPSDVIMDVVSQQTDSVWTMVRTSANSTKTQVGRLQVSSRNCALRLTYEIGECISNLQSF